jgi:hypothetical protein
MAALRLACAWSYRAFATVPFSNIVAMRAYSLSASAARASASCSAARALLKAARCSVSVKRMIGAPASTKSSTS